MADMCVCGQPAEPHACSGDPDHPARWVPLEDELRIRTCSECGTPDQTVQPGGGMCATCAELSALQAPAKERRWRLRLWLARAFGISLVALTAAVIWLLV